ncbi:hypothetical protein TPHA_0A04430 [Tetrapisispora phaffii CBS 4417]|uniref:Protein SOK1 n=1 Tax=Tetrapisispora phaffii (strain ATCC 24235 / CBS 4417 / NBRC 1672 / NRRL Y-8282 / UCD 70-5) TaxID=1071381 RepID=G8BNN8_TETPH|nr:hypothetical protein TPHA_0A04430 [Tetrapisispora phaffii CBS 4417]CCE61516.1 hypothetical protein TPHA_0A04430 [Tetrapisispora phaffii CBS 4417]
MNTSTTASTAANPSTSNNANSASASGSSKGNPSSNDISASNSKSMSNRSSMVQHHPHQHIKKNSLRDYTDSIINININKNGCVTPTINVEREMETEDDNSTGAITNKRISATINADNNKINMSNNNNNNDNTRSDTSNAMSVSGNITVNNSNSSSSFFKPFDPQTGQFINNSEDVNISDSDIDMSNEDHEDDAYDNKLVQTSDANDNVDIEIELDDDVNSRTNQDIRINPEDNVGSADNEKNTIKGVTTIAESENESEQLLLDIKKISNNNKFRSQSLPITLHSSLRRLPTFVTSHPQSKSIPASTDPSSLNDNSVESSNLNRFNQAQNHSSLQGGGGVNKRKYNRSYRSILRATNKPAQTSHPSLLFKKSSPDATDSSSFVSSSSPHLPTFQTNSSKINIQNDIPSNTKNSLFFKTNNSHNHKLISYSNLDNLTLEERIDYIKSTSGPLPLPPINLQCLKEIDLQEIVKNPQLRHDIVFDPLLQFRPNLDGERGFKKTQLADKYWKDVENELYVYMRRPEVFDYNKTHLVPLFDTLRDVLLTTVPQKESDMINGILDTELTVQELIKGSLQLSNFSDWLAELLKHHCAPMRDPWVDKMNTKFKESEEEASLPKLIEALKLVFQILEAMKLDIANHQIRILRPALLSNAIEFEKQYFHPLMNSNKIDFKSSLNWFNSKVKESEAENSIKKDQLTVQENYRLCIRSIISLLSCRKMVRNYPTTLVFDHTRLILLRADLRQVVCLLICRLLFQQLVASDTTISPKSKEYINKEYPVNKLKSDILSIISDEHGNCRWTKNIMSISIHFCKVINDLNVRFINTQTQNSDSKISGDDNVSTTTNVNKLPTLDQNKINFAKSWLSKQTQPLSEVYGVLERRVFTALENTIYENAGCTLDGRVKQDFINFCNTNTTNDKKITSTTPNQQQKLSVAANTHNKKHLLAVTEISELENSYYHLYSIVNFHWSVFGNYYIESSNNTMKSAANLSKIK